MMSFHLHRHEIFTFFYVLKQVYRSKDTYVFLFVFRKAYSSSPKITPFLKRKNLDLHIENELKCKIAVTQSPPTKSGTVRNCARCVRTIVDICYQKKKKNITTIVHQSNLITSLNAFTPFSDKGFIQFALFLLQYKRNGFFSLFIECVANFYGHDDVIVEFNVIRWQHE